MVLFQPPSGPPDPWSLGEYRYAPILLWIVAIVGIVWGFLLIVDYINKRKRHYLLWGASFSLMWIGFHQVISSGSYTILLEGFMATILAFIPGLLAAGLIMAVYEDKKFGDYYALFVLLMAILIGIFKFDPFYWVADVPLAPSIVVMILHIPSGLALVVIPILTTFKTKETRWPALFVAIGGLLLAVVGGLLAIVGLQLADLAALSAAFDAAVLAGILTPAQLLVLAEALLAAAAAVDEFLFVVFGLFPIILLFAGIGFALGTLIPAKWNFEIPGIEFEERA